VKLDIQTLIVKVYGGVRAILIDQVRVALEKAQLPLSQLFTKYDKNKDGFLEHSELVQALSECHLKLGANMRDILLSKILDPPAQGSSRGSGKISLGISKFYLEAGG
jgi:hypothetical protein